MIKLKNRILDSGVRVNLMTSPPSKEVQMISRLIKERRRSRSPINRIKITLGSITRVESPLFPSEAMSLPNTSKLHLTIV